MLKTLRRLIVLVLLAVAVLFALVNRAPVELSVWPLPYTVTAPLFLVILMVLLVGILIGAAMSWVGGHKYRALARQRGHEVEAMRRQLAQAREKLAAAPADGAVPAGPPAAAPPAIRPPESGAPGSSF